jgi:hypothetical protein
MHYYINQIINGRDNLRLRIDLVLIHINPCDT